MAFDESRLAMFCLFFSQAFLHSNGFGITVECILIRFVFLFSVGSGFEFDDFVVVLLTQC